MNCFNHPRETAVAQCSDCGKGLCHDCSTNYTFPICNTCNKKRINNERVEIVKELLVTFSFGILVAYFTGQLWMFDSDYSFSMKTYVTYYIIFIYIYSGIVSGWKTLTRITPAVFLILPLIGWLIYFAIKLFLAFWLGLIMLPIRTIRNIARLSELNKITI